MRLIILLILLVPAFGFAQENTPDTKPYRPPFTLKTTPLNLFNVFQQSIDLQTDIPLSRHWGIELGLNALVNSLAFARHKDERYYGFKLKPALKYYTKRSAWGDNYIALVLKYNDIRNRRYVNVFRQGLQYSEWLFQHRNMRTWGAALRIGMQEYFGPRKQWVIEPYVGLGVRQVHRNFDALPPDAEILNEDRGPFSDLANPGIYTTGDFLLGVSIGWAFYKH